MRSAASSHSLPQTLIHRPSMIRSCLSCIFFLLAVNQALHAQVDSTQEAVFKQVYAAAEREYGMHQELLNGALPPARLQDAIGHPYHLDYFSNQGSVSYRGKQYSRLNLRYDVFDQEVLLIYPHGGEEYQVWLHKEYIAEFSIENKRFVHESLGSFQAPRFYQVIGEGLPVKVLYHWEKGLRRVNAGNTEKSIFEEQKESYIFRDHELLSFTGNRSFTGSFPPEFNKAIKKYLREHSTKVKNATDAEMERLVEYVNTLSNGGGN